MRKLHLNESEITLPESKQGSHADEDVELTITLRDLTYCRQAKKQILQDQKLREMIENGLKDMSLFEKSIKKKFGDSSYVPLESIIADLRKALMESKKI